MVSKVKRWSVSVVDLWDGHRDASATIDDREIDVIFATDHDAAVDELVDALSETLDRIMWFRIWFEDEYLRYVEEDDPLLTEVARLGLNGRAETVLEKYRSDA